VCLKALVTFRKVNESNVQTFLMFIKRLVGDLASLSISEQSGYIGVEDNWAWEDEAIDFVAELRREAGKQVVF
jgi:hypothetical protein